MSDDASRRLSRIRAVVLAPAALIGSAGALLVGYFWFLRRSLRSQHR